MTIEDAEAEKPAYVIEINEAPAFSKDPILLHEVKVEIDKEGNMLDDSDYEYLTP